MKKSLLTLTIVPIAIVAGLLWFYPNNPSLTSEEIITENLELTPEEWRQKEWAMKKKRRQEGYSKMDQPDMFFNYHLGIRTRDGEPQPGYQSNYKIRELKKARSASQISNARTQMLDWVSRGPNNVPGRTRAILPLPNDPLNTWVIGSVGGGIWKSTDAGQNWSNKSEDFPTLAISSLATSEVNPSVIYAGSGELVGGSLPILGDGIFKSTDAGETWTQLASTANSMDFRAVTRVIVDPNNEDIVLASTAENFWDASSQSQIMRSIDGGQSWTKVYTSIAPVEQIIFTPGDFSVQYGTVNGVGVIKSIDSGQTWANSFNGMQPAGRVEIAASPVNPNRLFASAEGTISGNSSDLYVTDDAGATWNIAADPDNTQDFLGGQGGYDNTIMADPYDEDIVYYGGVNLWRSTITSVTNTIDQVFINVDENGTTGFWDVVNFGAPYYRNGLELGNAPMEDFVSVEVRFGPGISQMAHRFTVPAGATSGEPDANYSYQDYVEIPLQVWDIENDRQLMVSFRDQGADGFFNLLENNTSGSAEDQSREYLYIHSLDYDAVAPGPTLTTNGGHVIDNLYFFWPVLAAGGTWDPANLPSSELVINYSSLQVEQRVSETDVVSDAYGEFTGVNSFAQDGSSGIHPDHHYLVAVKVDEVAETYQILGGNDGGIYVSRTSTVPGINDGAWTGMGFGYVTSQFYGADKKPGANEYVGGMQDNGTWKSPVGVDATDATNYGFAIGGDGFQVLWNSADPRKVIGGSQFNNLRRTLNDGDTWGPAATGLTGNSPFFSKIENSNEDPNVVYTVTSDGVWKSPDFAGTWELTPITEDYNGGSFFVELEVGLADKDIIWAGAGMTGSSKMHVSTDGGQSFNVTNNYTETTLGVISGFVSHPIDPNTAYALFSFAEGPKVLRTTDLGQTWEDISGFGTNSVSNNGFPDVAVYSLLVMPYDPSIIWAGTDIGLFESTDNGASWHIADNGFPAASTWQMKVVDDQIVVATHGRGIWSLTVPELTAAIPQIEVLNSGTTPRQEIIAEIGVDQPFDSIRVFIDGEEVGLLGSNDDPVIYTIRVSGITDFGEIPLRMFAYKDGVEFKSFTSFIDYFEIGDYTEKYENDFTLNVEDFKSEGFNRRSQINGYTSPAFHSLHPYGNNSEHIALLLSPVIIGSEYPFITYNDAAIVEPGEPGSSFGDEAFKDYVVVEGSTDGLNWIPVEPGYDASADAGWLDEFNAEGTGSQSFLREEVLDLTNSFIVGDTIFVRFRLVSDDAIDGYGWVIDDLFIQEEPLGIDELERSDAFNMVLYPNPVIYDQVQIEYNLKQSSDVYLYVIDLSGRILEVQDLGFRSSGRNLVNKQVSLLPPGTYLIRLYSGSESLTRRLIIQ